MGIRKEPPCPAPDLCSSGAADGRHVGLRRAGSGLTLSLPRTQACHPLHRLQAIGDPGHGPRRGLSQENTDPRSDLLRGGRRGGAPSFSLLPAVLVKPQHPPTTFFFFPPPFC